MAIRCYDFIFKSGGVWGLFYGYMCKIMHIYILGSNVRLFIK